MASRKFEFSREGKDLRLSMAQVDITLAQLATAFQVVPDTLYIKEEWGDVTFWANDNGRFNLSTLTDGACLVIMGQEQDNTRDSATGNCLSYTAPPTASNKSKFPFRPFMKKSKSASSTATFGCKVILAKRNGKTFNELNQTYISLNEESANVGYVAEKVQEKWGDVTLVSGNGLQIQDEEGTRGSKFWKCQSRKIYAIKETATCNTTKKRPSHRSDDDFTDGEEENWDPKRKKSSRLSKYELAELKQETSNLREELFLTNSNVEECKSMLKDLIEVNKFLTLPPSVVKLVCDAFKCKVCLKAPINPPAIATRCCNVLLGCSQCINTWYSGDDALDKTCPQCREPRGYAQTFQFKGIDDFLTGFANILAEPVSQEQ